MSSHEVAQTLRAFTLGFIPPFKYINEPEDVILSNGKSPIDVSKIKMRTISIWGGNTDLFVPRSAIDRLIHDLTGKFYFSNTNYHFKLILCMKLID